MTTPYYADDEVTLYHGDCRDVLPLLVDASVDAIVCDPPYELGFMGKSWDSTGIAYDVAMWSECLRVLKPGGYLLAFGGARTFHRMACAVEDAGFQLRDPIAWIFGSGFPKAKTVLKPAFEPVACARKPFKGSEVANIQEHGTGALNIDACRIEGPAGKGHWTHKREIGDGNIYGGGGRTEQDFGNVNPHGGRWPTNVVLGGDAAAELDKQTGVSRSQIGKPRGAGSGEGWGMTATGAEYDDHGGASRFFPVFKYEAKAPTTERPRYVKEGAGSGRVTGLGGKVRQCNVCETRAIESGASEPSCGHGDPRWEEPTTDTASRVAHPTVKPLDLMRWLVRLVTPPGGTVLEPFAGSGTTAEACVMEHFKCIAIEREEDYLPLIVARLSKPMQVGFDFDGAA